MALVVKTGKRKGTGSSGSNAVKTKKAKVDDGSSSKPLNGKRDGANGANGANAVANGEVLKPTRRSTRSRAGDLLDEKDKVKTASNGPIGASKTKGPKIFKETASTDAKEKMPTSISKSNYSNTQKKGKGALGKATGGKPDDGKEISQDENLPFEDFSSDEDSVIDADQAAALLAGFESESESSDDDEGISLDKIPVPPKPSKAVQKEVATARKGTVGGEDEAGVLYVGRIPHGFYEHQMRAYFSQFGTITRLRLARNRKTGSPKHYGFIEFESTDVADIVARTMNKYLLFGHILQVRLMPKEQIHENLWKGANKRFKKIPWAAIQARGLKADREREVWERRVERESERRNKKKELLKEYDYEFDMPQLKKVQDVPARKDRIAADAISIETEEKITAITSKLVEEAKEDAIEDDGRNGRDEAMVATSGGKKRGRAAEKLQPAVSKKAKKTSGKGNKESG